MFQEIEIFQYARMSSNDILPGISFYLWDDVSEIYQVNIDLIPHIICNYSS